MVPIVYFIGENNLFMTWMLVVSTLAFISSIVFSMGMPGVLERSGTIRIKAKLVAFVLVLFQTLAYATICYAPGIKNLLS